MHSIILIIHIICMVLSLGLMTGASVMLFVRTAHAATLARIGMATTIVGTVFGAVLVAAAPVSMRCLELTVYLVIVSLAYRYVFGMGNATRCLQFSRTN